MSLAILIPLAGSFRSSSLPPLTVVASRRGVEPAILRAVKLLEELIGAELFERLSAVFEAALRSEVAAALNSTSPANEFPMLAERFWYRVLAPLAELGFSVQSKLSADRGLLGAVINAEKALAKSLAEMLRASGYERSEDLVYAMSALVDRDTWILERSAELRLENLVSKLVERDPKLILEFAGYTAYLAFAWTSAASAALRIVDEYRKENLDALTSWSRMYAEEVEDCLDSMDVLLDDEAYEEVRRLEASER